MRFSTVLLLFTILLTGCSSEKTQETPQSNHDQKSDHLKASIDTGQTKESAIDSDSTYEIQFDLEVAYGSTENVIVGVIETFTVDDSNRVYIADGNKTTIHVFNPDGSYLTSLGRRGNGPGEFNGFSRYSTMTIHSNRLFVTDFLADYPKGVQVFLLEDLSFSHTMKLIAENRNDYEELQGLLPKRFYPLKYGTFLVSYNQPFDRYEDKAGPVYFVLQDSTGRIVSGPVLKQRGLTYLVHEKPGGYIRLMHSFPFYGKSLLAVSGDDQLYTTWTKQYKINVYNSKGQHQRSFHHPFNNVVFDKDKVLERYKETNYMSQLGDGIALEMINEAHNLPEKWPALETMFFDDEDRLWISTVAEDFEIYEWWILKTSGEVITKFKWPRLKPIEAVQNGYMYTRETDEKTGLQQIIRYRIEMN